MRAVSSDKSVTGVLGHPAHCHMLSSTGWGTAEDLGAKVARMSVLVAYAEYINMLLYFGCQ